MNRTGKGLTEKEKASNCVFDLNQCVLIQHESLVFIPHSGRNQTSLICYLADVLMILDLSQTSLCLPSIVSVLTC